MNSFEIEWSGQERVTCESLRLSLLTINERNLDVGTAELIHFCERDDDDLIAPGTVVSLYIDDVRVFAGIAKLSGINDEASGHSRSITLCDAWQWLRDSAYFKGSGLLETDNVGAATMSECWDYLREYWTSYLTDYFYWPSYAETELPEVYWLSAQGVSRQQVASNLSALMRHYTHAAIRWDYSTEPPTMVVTKRNALARTFTYEAGDWISARLAPNDLTRPTAVSFRKWFPWYNHFTEAELPLSTAVMFGDHVKSAQTVIYPASGFSQGGPGTLVYFFNENDYAFVNENAAQWIYNMLQERLWSGEMALAGVLDLQVGDTINATGLHPDCEDMAAVVQSVRKDYFNETTTIQIGPTAGISGESIVERARAYSRHLRNWDNTNIPGSQIAPPT